MTGSAGGADGTAEGASDGPVIESLPSLCGCAGKTSLDRVVYPGRERLRARLTDVPVALTDAEDAAVLPLTRGLARATERVPVGDAATGPSPAAPTVDATDGRTWTLAATVAGSGLADPERFAEGLAPAYAALAARGPVTVGKGHSVQVPGATSRQWFEHLRPIGSRRAGYRAANVDAVHALPGLPAPRQARVALLHALADAYAVGATDERAVRPLLAVPDGDAPSTDHVCGWFREAAPPGVAVLPAAVLEHGGRGWLFGATATAAAPGRRRLRASETWTGSDSPPAAAAPEPGDAVLVHRPPGGLALYALAASGADGGGTSGRRERALAALTADHRPVARALAAFRPATGEAFDPDRHLKLCTDVSGPGVRGIARRVERATDGLRVHLTDLPLLDAGSLADARERWLLPDVTVETNGPLAAVARPAVAERIADRLVDLPGAAPRRLGELRTADGEPPLTVADGVDAGRYVESLLRSEHGTAGPPGTDGGRGGDER
jgi:hypothetical protein